MTRIFTLTLAAALATLAGPTGPVSAADKAKPPAQCFRPERIANFATVGDSVVNVRLQTAAVYQVTLVGACPGLDTYRSLTFDTSFSTQICDGKPATVISRSGIGPLRCAVKSIRLMPPAEAAALPDVEKP